MQANIENFYRAVAQNPALLNKIATDANTPDEFIDRAVAVANDEGYAIDRTEARSWIESQIAAKKNGELSDVQLEAVAGGKTGARPGLATEDFNGKWTREFMTTMKPPVGDWMKNW